MRVDALVKTIAADILAERRIVAQPFAECMMCGRSIDAEKAAREGGRRRFCSDRCMAYFDAGWSANRGPQHLLPDPGFISRFSDAKSASAAVRSRVREKQARVRKKQAMADSWKKYLAKQRSQVGETSSSGNE